MTKSFLDRVSPEDPTKELSMKRILFLISILSLFAYGCNRDQQEPAGGGTGLQEEQQRPDDVQALPESDVESVEPSMQEDSGTQRMEETDSTMESDEAFDSQSGMQEEQSRFNDQDSQNMGDERDSSMGSGTDTAPEAEPTDATGIQQ